MSDRENARRLLALANKDLQALTAMQDRSVFATEIFGFHAQQAVEKALKAWLSLAEARYPKAHDLGELLRLLEEAGQAVPAEFRELDQLTDFGVQFRYEAFDELGGELDRAATAEQVAKLVRHVERLAEGT